MVKKFGVLDLGRRGCMRIGGLTETSRWRNRKEGRGNKYIKKEGKLGQGVCVLKKGEVKTMYDT